MTQEETWRKVAFIGNSHIAYWPLEACFPEWDCRNFGRPGEGLAYVEAFVEDVGDCEAVVQFGSNDLYRLNEENLEAYADRYVEAVQAIRSQRTYLFCIFPRNDYAGGSTSVNRFIARLNAAIRRRVEDGGGIVYLDVFDRLLADGRLRPDMTVDDLHLNGAGYRVLAACLREAMMRQYTNDAGNVDVD